MAGLDMYEQILSGISEIRERQKMHGAAIEKLTDAVVRLAVIEERQASTNIALDELSTKFDRIDSRLDALEQSEVLNKQLRYWGFGLLTVIASGVVFALLRVVGL